MIFNLDSWQKMLEHEQPSLFLRSYFSADNFATLPKYLHNIANIPAGPIKWHSGSVLDHLCRCADAVAGDSITVWMAIVHDFGKLTTPTNLLPHHYGHEERGQGLAKDFAEKIGMHALYRNAGVLAAKLHMRAGRYNELKSSKKRDLLIEVEEAGFTSSFWKLVDADKKSSISLIALDDLASIMSIVHNSETLEQWRMKQIEALKCTIQT